MASSSSSSSSSSLVANTQGKFEVFLSFRGEIRTSFISHLHAALLREEIVTFLDEERIKGGDEIKPSLLDAIEKSTISVVIFSEGYASSGWCLDELVKILECKKLYRQTVLPVFYHVHPTDVGNQTGTYQGALAELGKRYRENEQKAQRWRENEPKWKAAMAEAAKITGFSTKKYRTEAILVDTIVERILEILNRMSPSDNKDLVVGVQSSITEIESLLHNGSEENLGIIGIWGMGGIGKTTIAWAVYRKIKNQFDYCSFIENVREKSVNSDTNLTITKRKLDHKNVLIVLDDVTSVEQIRALIGDFTSCLGLRGQIIITTRDRQVFQGYKVRIYEVKGLSNLEALQLFRWCTFEPNEPTSDYDCLSKKVVKYTQGVPLALKKWGYYLYKYKQSWASAIKKLQAIPHEEIQQVLKVSYDELDPPQKKMFLDIACFFKWENRDFVINLLVANNSETEDDFETKYDFMTKHDFDVLKDKCLISITSDNKISVNDLLQAMAREIVRKESEFLEERSRLWYHEHIRSVLRKNTGTRKVEGICLDMSKIGAICLRQNGFGEMHNLRFLKLHNPLNAENINKVLVSRDLQFIFTDLRYLCWHGCPLKSLQLNFQTEYLVALEMPHSNVEQLWTDVQHFDNLKYINLSHSKHLVQIPDFSLFPNLESLILEGCTRLLEISISIEHLKKLVILSLRHCRSLKSLPRNICSLTSLEHLLLSGCSELDRLPDNLRNLKALKVLEANLLAISEVPSSIEYLGLLIELNLADCSIMNLPNNFSRLSSLQILLLGGNNFESIPSDIRDLSKLLHLDLCKCKKLQSLPELPSSLESIDAHSCSLLEASSSLSILCPTKKAVRVNFINCFKLDQNALKGFIKVGLEKIGHPQVTEFCCRTRARICFPETDIPECITSQSTGSFITFKLPQGSSNKSFLSFAVSAVVQFRNYCEGQGLEVGYECRYDTVVVHSGTLMSWECGTGPRFIESDHVFLGYDFLVYDAKTCNNNGEMTLQFYVKDLNSGHLDACDVKKCGFRLLHFGVDYGEEQDETGPPCKRLRFSDQLEGE